MVLLVLNIVMTGFWFMLMWVQRRIEARIDACCDRLDDVVHAAKLAKKDVDSHGIHDIHDNHDDRSRNQANLYRNLSHILGFDGKTNTLCSHTHGSDGETSQLCPLTLGGGVDDTNKLCSTHVGGGTDDDCGDHITDRARLL